MVQIDLDSVGCVSNFFMISKASGGLRPVFNLKSLNKFIRPVHFKMEGIHLLRDLIGEGHWFMKLDPKDTYLTVQIHSDDQKFLHFLWKCNRFQYRSLPFGLSSASWAFTKLLFFLVNWETTVVTLCQQIEILGLLITSLTLTLALKNEYCLQIGGCMH